MSLQETKSSSATEFDTIANLTLIVDAKARTKRFAICSEDGTPLSHGFLFGGEFNGEQSSSEMAAAKRAVWVASKVREIVDVPVIHLLLKVDAMWLTWTNEVAKGGKRGGKARSLAEYATKLGVKLNVVHIPGVSNPADKYTIASDAKRWQDNDWGALVLKTKAGQRRAEIDRERQEPCGKATSGEPQHVFGSVAVLMLEDKEPIQELNYRLKWERVIA